ncbi:general secretion pathway protein D [Cyanobium sp. Candia 9D4]|uniref:General secretion pathway protein D n=1 Tax=Aphanothece cf. minutissima CCALA 015 TaxID=2107695 RepID=A0ABX5FBN6_9CHRO|nr:general secretion pathway protein D [Cyanobium sp. Candia 9D4]PSB39226.1 general secretion pathway protein D [Aphanothece cf. minutissima CCALA 015]
MPIHRDSATGRFAQSPIPFSRFGDQQNVAKRQWRRVLSVSLGVVILQGTGVSTADAAVATSRAGGVSSTRLSEIAQASGSLDIKLRRLPDSVEVVIEGTGPSPMLQQTTQGAVWLGRLQTAQPMTLRRGPVRLSLPEAGLQSISFEGSGNVFDLKVSPTPGFPVGRPVVSGDGRSLILTFNAPAQPTLQTLTPNVTTPGRVPQPGFVPPLQPRAVAPPLGDMAVGTMTISNPSYVSVSGPPVTMTLRNAPAKDVLMALSQLGGYGFVYVGDTPAAGSTPAPTAAGTSPDMRPISISFRRENYGRAINSALLAAGLQGKRDGNTIFAGPNVLAKSFGAQLSKVYRLNQVPANSAADYLANLGAQVTKTNTITTAVSEGVAATAAPAGSPTASTTTASTTTTVESFGATNGPLIGLRATTDTRLGTITLVGAPRLVAIAEQYLRQLDLRQRQVALSVKILDVNLQNDTELYNSFAFRWGNNFIVNDNGTLAANFGGVLGGASVQRGLDAPLLPGQPLAGFVGQTNPGAAVGAAGQPLYPNNNFFDFFQARILSDNSKVLASPTLILQEDPSILRDDSSSAGGAAGGGEGSSIFSSAFDDIDAPIGRRRGNEGVVRVGINVPTEVSTTITGTAGAVTCSIDQLSTAGLVLGARVQKIDDNGFVTFSLSPSISAVEREITAGGCPPISILRVRRLDTGVVRVRDGQTLILTGVISDFDRALVSKWPILGDIPIIGQFFRASSNNREKRELVIMVTPRIINDTEGGTYGYGYQPSTPASRAFLGGEPQPPMTP